MHQTCPGAPEPQNIEYSPEGGSKGGFARAAQALPLRQAPARRMRRVSLSLFLK